MSPIFNNNCVDCGKTIWDTGKRCVDCWHKFMLTKDYHPIKSGRKPKPKLINYCKICKKEISCYHKVCRNCWEIILKTSENPAVKRAKPKIKRYCSICNKPIGNNISGKCKNCYPIYANPMKIENVKTKMRETTKQLFSQKDYIHPNKGKLNLGASKAMKLNNPMKNPEIAKKTSGKNHWSHTKPDAFFEHMKNINEKIMKWGFVSKGQQQLYDTLTKLNIPFEPNCPIRVNKRHFFLDTYIPILNMAIEYDGYYTHREFPEYDQERDFLIKNEYDIDTIRLVDSDLKNLEMILQEKLDVEMVRNYRT